MTLYTGSGYRCQASGVCGFRVMPASGEDRDLDEAVRMRAQHERICRFRGVSEPIEIRPPRTIGERLDQLAVERVQLEDEFPLESMTPESITPDVRRPSGATRPRIFNCRCVVCGEMFAASGPRSMYCPKPRCQSKRRSAA
jgi:hypothetical protein